MPFPTCPNEGLGFLLEYLVSRAITPDEALNVRLYANDYTPLITSTLPDFVEANFLGYQAVTLYRQDWANPVPGSARSSIQPANGPVKFFNWSTGPETVYGVFIVGGISNKVYYCYRFNTPRVIQAGSQLWVNLTVYCQSIVVG